MSFEKENHFTKENLDTYLKELAKEFRRINGKSMPAEIILVGGAAILAHYGFRDATTDIDAIIHAASSMKDAINHVGDKFGLPNGWLNTDFMRTTSYSSRLLEFAVYYKTFYGILTVRVVSAEFLIAMKLRSDRRYKNDRSDIIGILNEHSKAGNPISFQAINDAVSQLYGSWSHFPQDAKAFIEHALREKNYEEVYYTIIEEEEDANEILVNFEAEYPNTATQANVEDILKTLKAKRENQ